MSYKSDINKISRTTEAVEFPTTILIDNINACNLRCSMCDHPNMKKYRKVQILDFELYKKIVREIAHENPSARVWEIFFGDPFLCRDMPKRIAYAKNMGLTDVVLNSNGMMMSPQRSLALITAGLDAMYVGVDSTSSDIYRQIRVGGNYEKVVNNVLAYRDNLLSHGNPNQKLFVQFVVSDINEHEVELFRKFWTENGVNVKIRPKISWAGLVTATNLQPNSNVKRLPCFWLMQTINICADGTVALCSVDVHRRVNCGDVNNSSIKEIWAATLKKYREMHKEGRFSELPEMCRNCSDWQSAYSDYKLA